MPGLRGALAVRVNDGVTDRIVTRYCRGLKFTKVAPGGHQSLAFTMVLPRNTFNALNAADRAYVYDARTAKTIIEGYLENPTPNDGPDGQQFDVSAVGGMALANDETRALIYVDTDLSQWTKEPISAAGATVETMTDVAQVNTLKVQFPQGQLIANNAVASAVNMELQRAGMRLGGIHVVLTTGKTDANYTWEFKTLSGSTIASTLVPSPGTADWFVVDHFIDTDYFVLLCRRIGASTNVADDQSWVAGSTISVVGRRMDRNGTLLNGAAGHLSATQVLASQIVEDLLGRLLTFCDPGTAQVDATTFGITRLAYPDGVKAAGVLNDLAVFEPGYLWEILETLDNGKHRFNYRAWPTTPRYEVSTRDDWKQRGSDVDLCNRILVNWTDGNGNAQSTPVTAASLGLVGIGLPVDDLGARVKDADPITLPEGKGSAANATRIGGQILTDKINPPKSGTILVRRPIIDQLTGNTVMPWEIEPGYICRVRETGDDLRITQVDYDDDSCSMLLTLGAPVLTDEQRLARLDRVAGAVLAGT
jgi:hypothetical protein